MSNEKSLWLPNGFGKGTIIYDLEGNPWEAVEKIGVFGVNIWSIVKVEKDYALKAIELGANKLISTDKE